jgi:hypothetical protein
VPHPGTPVARGHLRLAGAPVPRRPTQNRLVMSLRAVLCVLGVVWFTLAAWVAAAPALLPLAWRRAPVGHRLRPRPPQEARVIPFQPRRRAVPR